MKKFYSLLFAIILLSLNVNAQNPNYQWAYPFGSTGAVPSSGDDCFTDPVGNIYYIGTFQGTVDFDPSAGVANLVSNGATDAFIAKYSSSGTYQWAFNIGGTGSSDGIRRVCFDASNNVYITGSFQNTVDFNPGAGVANLIMQGTIVDGFVAKYTSAGIYQWAFQIKNCGGTGICSDASSNVYVFGQFSGVSDFDPGVGTVNLNASTNGSTFIGKYNSSGTYLSAINFGNLSPSDKPIKITIDAASNLYITGYFVGVGDYDPGVGIVNLTPVGANDIFVAKYTSSLSYQWAFSIGGTGQDWGEGICVDASSNVYITGLFNNTADFDPGAGVSNLTCAGSNDIYIAKYNSLGIYQWAKQIGSSGADEGYGIILGQTGDLFLTGVFRNTVDFDPGPGVTNLVGIGAFYNSFVAGFSPSGSFKWAFGLGEPSGNTFGLGITTDAANNIYIAGDFGFTIDFDPSLGVANVTSFGTSTNGYLAKYCQSPDNSLPIIGPSNLCLGSGSTTFSVQSIPTATSYTWSLPAGWSGSSSTNSVSATPGTSGVFSVTASNACGSSSAQILSVTVTPLPIVSASTSNSLLCVGQSATLTANGASTYTFNPGGSGSSIVVSPSTTTTYSVTGTNAQGCTNSSAFTQSVSACTAINTNAPVTMSGVEVYPNPTNGLFTITGVEGTVSIYNVLGELVLTSELQITNSDINLSNQPTGIYFVRIGSVSKKLIKE